MTKNKKRLCIGRIGPNLETGHVHKFVTREVTLACGRQLPVYHITKRADRR